MTNGVGGGNTAPVAFYFMKEGHYSHKLGLSRNDGEVCYVPEDHPSRSTILGLNELGVDGLIRAVRGIVLRLPFDTFSPSFSVDISPDPQAKFSELISAGGIDLSGMTIEQAQANVRDLVNKKLQDLN